MPNYNYNTSHWSSFDVKLRSNYKFAGFKENSSLYEYYARLSSRHIYGCSKHKQL